MDIYRYCDCLFACFVFQCSYFNLSYELIFSDHLLLEESGNRVFDLSNIVLINRRYKFEIDTSFDFPEKEEFDFMVFNKIIGTFGKDDSNKYKNEIDTCRVDRAPIVNQIQFSFAPIHGCNLRCKYCFANHGENFSGSKRVITREMIDAILDFVYFRMDSKCKSYRIDFVSGGEPLLNFNAIEYTISKSAEMLNNSGKKLEIFLVTNGTINDNKIWDFLNKNNVNLGISIDGCQNIHDENRVWEDNTGTYKQVVDTIKSIQQSEKLSHRTKDIWGLSVITGKSKNLEEIILHNKHLGLQHMQMELVRINKEEKLALREDNISNLIEEYRKLTEFFIGNIKRKNLENLKMILNDNDYFGKIICRVISGGEIYYRCLAGIGKINIDANGNIYPCELFVGDDNFIIGNVFDGIDQEKKQLFLNENVESREQCSRCWAKYICGGDCYYNSYIANKNIYFPDAFFCRISKKMIEFSLVIMYYLKSNGVFDECNRYIKIRKLLSERELL